MSPDRNRAKAGSKRDVSIGVSRNRGPKRRAAVILAAGKGVRMISSMPKALCELSGKAMAEFLIEAARDCGIKDLIVVGGYRIDLLRKRLFSHTHDIKLIRQSRLLGSADAVRQTERYFKGFNGTVVVLYADTPLIKPVTIRNMLKKHNTSKAAVTLLSGRTDNPKDYGRVVRDSRGRVCGIVEHTDLSVFRRPSGRGVRHFCPEFQAPTAEVPETSVEVNVGAYCFDSKRLFEGLRHIKKNRRKGEFYLTDIISYLYHKGYPVSSYATTDDSEILGINRQEDLIQAEEILRKRTINSLLQKGVTIKDPATTYIQEGARIHQDTVIYPFVVIERGVFIGKGCRVGPFAHLRAGTVLKDNSEIGNFVEIVRSSVGNRSKAKHHSYIGDTIIGRKVNVGAGTITANYDGKKKHKTVIKDGALIGSGTTIVAPVRIGEKAITGAGSVVVKGRDVPPGTVVVGVPARPLKKGDRSL